MLKSTVTVLYVILAVANGQNLSTDLNEKVTCVIANDQIDEVLKTSNANILTSGKNVAPLPGFESDISISVFGVKLFEIGKSRVEKGRANGLNLLTRAGDLKICSNSAGQLLEGDLMYETLDATFEFTYKLLFWTAKASVTYTIPTSNFNLYASKVSDSCNLLKFNFSNLNNIRSTIKTTSWLGRLMSAITGHFKLTQIPLTTLRTIEDTCENLVSEFFLKAWCSSK